MRLNFSSRQNVRFGARISFILSVVLLMLWASTALNASPFNYQRYASSATTPAIWPTAQHDAARTGYSPNPGADSNSTDWIFGPTGQIRYSPVIGSDGTIYAVDTAFHLFAINPDGSLKWTKTFNEGLFTPAIGPDGTIYVPGTRHLYAFNPDGSSPWITPYNLTTSRNSLIAISTTGIIFEVDNNGTLYAINPFNTVASSIWSLKVGCLPATLAVGPSGSIYCGTSSNGTAAALVSISPNGAFQWSFNTKSSVNVPPAIGTDGTIYTVSSGGAIYAIYPTGSQMWALYNIHQEQTSPIIGPNGTLYVSGELGTSGSPGLIAINSGSEGWSEFCYSIGGSVCVGFGPIVSLSIDNSGNIYVGTNTSGFISVNSAGGLRWVFNSLPTGEGIISPQAVSYGGTIYIGTSCLSCNGTGYGHLFAIGRPSGYSPLSVTASGLPAATTWSFLVDGRNYTTSSTSLFFSLPDGNYSWTAPPSRSYVMSGVRYGATQPTGSVGIPTSGPISLSYSSQYQVNFSSSPSTGGVINTPSGDWYTPNSVVDTDATVLSGYQFGTWRTDSASIAIANLTLLSTKITINGPGNVVGVFNPLVTISAGTGGSVIYLDPPYVGTLGPGQSASFYAPSESIIVLTARPESGYSFANWNSVYTAPGFDNFSPNVDFRITSPTNMTAQFAVQASTATTFSTGAGQLTSSTTVITSTTVQPTISIPTSSVLPTRNVALDVAAAVLVGLIVALAVAFFMGVGVLKKRTV